MKIEIKKTTKPIKYNVAIKLLEKRLAEVNQNKSKELIWILEHPSVFTAGKMYKKDEILDQNVRLVKTSRGGKITWHGPGQLICYFVIDLKRRKKDIRKFINIIEKSIIETLKKYQISSFSDRKNVGIWTINKKKIEKIAAIGIRVTKWIAYHGFSININNNLGEYKKIVPCGIANKGVTNLLLIKNQNYADLKNDLISSLLKNLK